ncbi:MAG: hypothetical protein LQ340_002546 [Diploschistes diacapsis]|nr:MAG: hypothetical protein LQ340_002546 [Diploschistes diacapsis]
MSLVALPPSQDPKPQRSKTQCVPATKISRRRKRRFPERELLDRLRKYEDLLRQNNVKFEPLHKDLAGEKESPNVKGNDDSDDEQAKTVGADRPSPSAAVNAGRTYEAK